MNTGKHSYVRENISIDAVYGIAAFSSAFVEARDNYIYGSKNMKNHDCPGYGVPCNCPQRNGIIAPTFGKNKNFVLRS